MLGTKLTLYTILYDDAFRVSGGLRYTTFAKDDKFMKESLLYIEDFLNI